MPSATAGRQLKLNRIVLDVERERGALTRYDSDHPASGDIAGVITVFTLPTMTVDI